MLYNIGLINIGIQMRFMYLVLSLLVIILAFICLYMQMKVSKYKLLVI